MDGEARDRPFQQAVVGGRTPGRRENVMLAFVGVAGAKVTTFHLFSSKVGRDRARDRPCGPSSAGKPGGKGSEKPAAGSVTDSRPITAPEAEARQGIFEVEADARKAKAGIRTGERRPPAWRAGTCRAGSGVTGRAFRPEGRVATESRAPEPGKRTRANRPTADRQRTGQLGSRRADEPQRDGNADGEAQTGPQGWAVGKAGAGVARHRAFSKSVYLFPLRRASGFDLQIVTGWASVNGTPRNS